MDQRCPQWVDQVPWGFQHSISFIVFGLLKPIPDLSKREILKMKTEAQDKNDYEDIHLTSSKGCSSREVPVL